MGKHCNELSATGMNSSSVSELIENKQGSPLVWNAKLILVAKLFRSMKIQTSYSLQLLSVHIANKMQKFYGKLCGD